MPKIRLSSLDLYIFRQLAQKPAYGYQFRTTPGQSISSIYACLKKWRERKIIQVSLKKGSKTPQRKLYSLNISTLDWLEAEILQQSLHNQTALHTIQQQLKEVTHVKKALDSLLRQVRAYGNQSRKLS